MYFNFQPLRRNASPERSRRRKTTKRNWRYVNTETLKGIFLLRNQEKKKVKNAGLLRLWYQINSAVTAASELLPTEGQSEHQHPIHHQRFVRKQMERKWNNNIESAIKTLRDGPLTLLIIKYKLERVESWVRLFRTGLGWFEFCLKKKDFFVSLGQF